MNIRKELHLRESEWLQAAKANAQKGRRSKYLEMRQIYSNTIRREKRMYQKKVRDKLKQKLKSPMNF